MLIQYLKNKLDIIIKYCEITKWKIYIFFIFLLLIVLGEITLYRFFIFVLIIIYIIIYTRLLRLIEEKLNGNFFFLINNDIALKYLLEFLIKLYGIKNPFLLIIFKVDNKIFDFLRVINYKLLQYNNLYLLLWINILIINLITNPLKIIYTKFYDLFIKWKNLKIIDILIYRMFSTILSILIFTELICMLLFYFGIFYTFIIIYLFFFLLGVIRMRAECLIGTPFLDFIKIDNLYNIKLKRKKCTLLGIFISNLYNYINSRFIEIDIDKFNNIYYCIEFFFIRNYKERLFLEKIICFPSWYNKPKMEGIWKEFKKKPSYFMYTLLVNNLSFILLDFSNFVYIYLFKLKEFKKNEYNIFIILYKIKLLSIKLLFFYKLDIELYVDIENTKNNIPVWDFSSKCLIFNDENKLGKKDFIIENKKDEEFFDIYLNETFYEKLFFFINIENFQNLKKTNINMNIDLLSNAYKESIKMKKILEFINFFATSNMSKEMLDIIKWYMIELINEYYKENNINTKKNMKNKYLSLLNELELLHYELILVKFTEKNESK